MKTIIHFLTLADYTKEDLLYLLARSRELKKGMPGKGPSLPLAGKIVGMIFEKPSTRTRVSFEVGVRQLGGDPIFLSAKEIQLDRGEPISDTARVLSRYLDAIVIRTYGHDTLESFVKWATVPIINGLSDFCHPCQVLGDLLTLQERGIDLGSMKAAWVGDGNNVANSWIDAANILGFELTLACPDGYHPNVNGTSPKVRIVRDPIEAVGGVQVISTDVWTSMGQEAENQARRRIFRDYRVGMDLLSHAGEGVYVLHCLPAHRGEEITDEVMESRHSLIWDQAENRLHVQKAVLEFLLS
jgi:ornithine carbamoyltransferase